MSEVTPNKLPFEGGNRPPPADDCEQLRALLPAYSIGAADPDEVRLVETLLERCPEGAAELAEYEALAESLLHGAPPVEPPAALRASLLAALDAQATLAPAVAAPAAMPPAPAARLSLFPTAATRWMAAVAAVAVLVLIGSNLFWLDRDAAARARAAELMAREQAVLAMLEQQTEVLASLGDVTTERYELASTDAGPASAQAVAFWKPGNAFGLLSVAGLPELESGRTYQMWLIRGDETVPAGLLDVNEDGRGTLIFEASEPVTDFEALGLTDEPEGGSQAPTTTPILVGVV